MPLNTTHALMAAAVVGAAAFAWFHDDPAPAFASTTGATPPAAVAPGGAGTGSDGEEPTADEFAPASEAPALLTWKAPAAWSPLPNPSTMRLATHKVPRAAGDVADAELSVSRAGGDTEANIDRWIGQFQSKAGNPAKRRTKTVQGFNVSVVEVDGTYAGGMGASNASHENWALLGAIVETPPQSYFFKLTGPAATVHAARKAFDEMIDGIIAP